MNPYLYNTPDDDASLLEWGAIHQSDHFLITNEIFRKMNGRQTILLPIDPVPVQLDMLTWAQNHQTMHNEMDTAVGVSGFDLSSVNFAQHDQLLIWMNLHALEHYQVWQALSAIG
jgi:hypothetical protein